MLFIFQKMVLQIIKNTFQHSQLKLIIYNLYNWVFYNLFN